MPLCGWKTDGKEDGRSVPESEEEDRDEEIETSDD